MRPEAFTFQKTLKHWCLLLDGKEPSTNKTMHPGPNREAEKLCWWYEADRIHDGGTARNLAYLLAYLEVFGPVLPMKGLAVNKGWIYPDRAVMRSLHADKTLAVEGTSFLLTPEGHARVAPYLVQDGTKFRRTQSVEQKG